MESKPGVFSLFRNSDRLSGTFPWSKGSQCSLASTFHHRRSRTLKTGFFMQVRQLKIIQMKNPGNALHSRQGPEGKGVTRIMRSYKTEPRVALVLVNAVSQAYNGM